MNETRTRVVTRPLGAADLEEVVRIDALHTGAAKRTYWSRVFEEYLPREGRTGTERTFGFGVQRGDGLAGYILGEVRAVEFGSGPCGWVFSVGIEAEWQRLGVATALLEAACRQFRSMGVTQVRTMVARNDVPVLSYFRANGFVGGPYVQLELDLDLTAEVPR